MVNNQYRNLNSCRGMSLVELLVVMTILSVVMMAVMSLYIPAHQSTVTQTQVSDVHANLRLALNTMTRDLLTAGFLEPRFPVVFPDASPSFTAETLTARGTYDPANPEFIIRTRAVGSGFARVAEEPTGTNDSALPIKVADPAMVLNFPVDSRFRVFGAMNGTELIGTIKGAVSSANRVFKVVSYNSTTVVANLSDASLTSAELDDLKEIMLEAVMIRVKDDGQPALQTIRYRLNNGALERIINGSTQILARNLDTVAFSFGDNDQGRVNLVEVKLTGKTDSEDKVREAETAVRLRNIY
ncbi:MAG: prepilin-type N-terminal cleavage/methylation domain-containing protein [Desulfuromonadales bacterium]|nr:prepilin-type N-terminal cleavage/methylation domain-containing protein [Desulfuromonadales bacterium]